MNRKMVIPLIKENRLSKLIMIMKCFDRYPRNRDKQKDCVLKLYPGKSEKSVFRGMIIPSLRQMGFIIGHGDLIRLSSNGKLLLEARKRSKKEALRVARIILFELDKEKFHFIRELKKILTSKKTINKKKFVALEIKKIKCPYEKQKVERINKWIKILKECGLIKIKDEENIMIQKENLRQAESELLPEISTEMFRNILFKKYGSLPYSETAGIIDITFLREIVAIEIYKKFKIVLTENQFDRLLRRISFVTKDYVISLGHPMGSEEKLFYYKGEYYRTLSISVFKERMDENG